MDKVQINNFFDEYANRFNLSIKGDAPDVEETTGCFADFFIESSPNGVICKKNDDEFKKVVPQGYSFYKKIGITAMDIVSKEITILDDLHAMCKTVWKSSFTKKDQSSGDVEFTVIYLLRSQKDEPKIFAYITGDEQKVLKELGLI